MNPKVEYRQATIKRAATLDNDTGEYPIQGVAVPYDTKTQIGYWFEEEVAPGAFRDSLANADIVLLAGHGGMPYARVGADTLKFDDRDDGLHFESSLDLRDPDAQSKAAKIDRGDLTGVSIGFYVFREEWTEPKDKTEYSLRRILEGELVEISMTPFPAYKDTELQAQRDAGLAIIEAAKRATRTQPVVRRRVFNI